MTQYKIIVARYNENVNWLLPQIEYCIIYNKGKRLNVKNEVLLNNVGRESDTYLNYIIDNYYKLPDVVLFTQANITDELKYIKKILKEANEINILLKLKNMALKYGKSLHSITYNNTNNENNKNWTTKHYWGKEWNKNGNTYHLHNNHLDKPVVFEKWFVTHIDKVYPNPIKIYKGAIFAIRRDLILKRPINYYKNLLHQVNHHVDPAEGHFVERSWWHIFN
tara:strand:- start:222 stop:887 length:666 start_codon:yes stop_codon:yes gene_type:complete